VFGEIVRAYRQRWGITQEELADRTGVSERTIRNIETGRIGRPRSASVRRLADAFALHGAERDHFHQTAQIEARPRPGVDAAAGPSRSADWPLPAQLPADVRGFTGRADHLRGLTARLDQRSSATAVLITGSAGVGKTTLAVHWAHRVADRFPDGQLYINLRGYAPAPPLRSIDALAPFLRALGVAPGRIPLDTDEAAALYRSLLADRRMLVLLDNAGRSTQVRPLLPGHSSCLALVTSRDTLTGLEVGDGADRLTVDTLGGVEAHSLMARLVGHERVRAEPDATADLARLCGHLPLALRIAAAHLTRLADLGIASYVSELSSENRLALLQVDEDPQVAVRAAFDLSYVTVPGAEQRLFRLLGLIPGDDFTAEAAAALTDVTPPAAQRLLEQLAHAHLIERCGPGRYNFHDLLRLYARGCAYDQEPEREREAALDRLFDGYLATADAAVEVLYPQKLRLPQPARPHRPEFDTHTPALAWLNAERGNLVAAITYAADQGRRPTAWLLADVLRAYFFHTLYTVDWLTVARTADVAADIEGAHQARAAAQLSLADLHWRRSEHHQATEHTMRALALAEQTGWSEGQAAAHSTLGGVCWVAGHLAQAEDHLVRALSLNQRTGRLVGQAINLSNLGLIHGERGRLARARDLHIQALALHGRFGSNAGEAVAMTNLGETRHLLGQIQEGISLLTASVTYTRNVGDRVHEANALCCLAAAHRDLASYDHALTLATTAQECLDGTEYHRGKADIRNVLGDVLIHKGQHQQAIGQLRQALDIARRVGDRYPETAALIGLATAHSHLEHHTLATAFGDQALAAARHAGFRLLEGNAHTTLAHVHHRQGHRAAAKRHAEDALAIHRETGQRLAEARTLVLLGTIHRDTHDTTTALAHWRHAHELFTEIGAPEGTVDRSALSTVR
jgi:tetratricopeptide (TPR) repeat protein/transcriptional regulator with XRE-family HTH domain